MNNSKINLNHEDRFLSKLLLQNKKIKRKKQIRYLSIAASLAFLVALPLYFFLDFHKNYVAESPFSEEVQEVIKSYQAKLDAEIEEIQRMACYTQMQTELAELQKNSLPSNELAILPIEKQLYYIEQIYTIKIEAVQYMQTVCGGV
jgi:Zn-dependent protease with chaperone function